MNAPCPNVTVKHALVAESRLPFCYRYYSGTQQVILQKILGGNFLSHLIRFYIPLHGLIVQYCVHQFNEKGEYRQQTLSRYVPLPKK